MTWMDADASALGGVERSDEAPKAGVAHARRAPDPEVVAKPTRRQFTALAKDAGQHLAAPARATRKRGLRMALHAVMGMSCRKFHVRRSVARR